MIQFYIVGILVCVVSNTRCNVWAVCVVSDLDVSNFVDEVRCLCCCRVCSRYIAGFVLYVSRDLFVGVRLFSCFLFPIMLRLLMLCIWFYTSLVFGCKVLAMKLTAAEFNGRYGAMVRQKYSKCRTARNLTCTGSACSPNYRERWCIEVLVSEICAS